MSARVGIGAPVLSIGETLIDLIASDGATRLEDVSTFVARPGGAPANVVVALARLGVPSAFCGVVGNDPFGVRLRATLAAEGVDASRLRGTDTAETTIAFAWKDERGDGQFRLLRMADRLLSDLDVEMAGIERVAAVVVGSVALAAEPSRSAVSRAVALAAAQRVPVCVDVNVRPTIWPGADEARAACEPIIRRATLLKLSLDDARYLLGVGDDPEQAIDRLGAFGAPFTILTDGGRGAWFAARGQTGAPTERYVPAFPVAAIEPTGAGDAFTAGVISRLLAKGWTTLDRDDVVFAAAAGALTTTRRGAMDALPSRADIDAFLAVRGSGPPRR